MLRLNYIDLSIVIIFLGVCLIIGLYKTTKIKTLREFAVGYKNISVTVLVCTIFSSSTGAGSTIGITGKIYEFGLSFAILQLLVPLYWLITARIIGANIDQFKGCITLGEVMYKLYGAPGRWITAIALTIRSLGSLAAQALALGSVFYYFLGIDPGYGILVGYGIITIYAALGGIRAVIYTEIYKYNIFSFIIPISYIVIFSRTGGLESCFQHLPESYLKLKLSDENIRIIASFALYSLLPGFHPDFIQRCLIAKDARQLERSLKMTALISLPFSASLCLIAYKMRADFPDIPPDIVLFRFVDDLPIGLKGTMVTGLIAIIMSVAEAKINATSIILVNDVLKVIYPKISEKLQLFALRAITFILSAVSLAIIKSSNDILDILWLVANFWGPIVTMPTLSGFLGFRTNSKSFIASVITAVLFTITAGLIAGDFAIMSWSFGILGSAIGLFGMHYYQIATGQIHTTLPLPKKINFASLAQSIIATAQNKVRASVNNAINLIKEHPGHHKLKIREFCTYTLAYYFAYSLDLTSDPDHEIFAYLLIIGYFFCLLLLFREFVFSKKVIDRYLHYYWYFLVTFCLPFVSSYMLFVSKGDDFWIINGILSAFSLYLFVDARRFLLLYSIGLLGGFILFRATGHRFESFEEITTASSIGYVYLFFLFTTLFFIRKKEKEQEEKIETMHIFGGAMAHEVKSPLATMSMYADTINSLFQQAFSTKRKEGRYYNIQLYEDDAHTLLEFSNTLKKISSRGIDTVNNLLTSLKSNVIADDKKEYLIEQCIKQAILEYELSESQKDGINIRIVENFRFYGSMHYTKHVIFNLLTNAYKYGGKSIKIDIWTENNRLHFRDNGKGIMEEDLPFIFDRFYSKSKSGTGIGLAFCKMIMEDIRGSIQCKSKPGKYTEFILCFPKIKAKRKKLLSK